MTNLPSVQISVFHFQGGHKRRRFMNDEREERELHSTFSIPYLGQRWFIDRGGRAAAAVRSCHRVWSFFVLWSVTISSSQLESDVMICGEILAASGDDGRGRERTIDESLSRCPADARRRRNAAPAVLQQRLLLLIWPGAEGGRRRPDAARWSAGVQQAGMEGRSAAVGAAGAGVVDAETAASRQTGHGRLRAAT